MLVEDGLVTGLYTVRNPEKLRRLDEVTSLTRCDRARDPA